VDHIKQVTCKMPCFWRVLLLVLTIPALAWGAEFSAQMLVKDGEKTFPGKIYVSDGKMRHEFIDERGQTVTIVRPDKKVVWVLIPPGRTYLEMPLTTKLPGQFLQIPPQAVNKRQVGHDLIEGYETDKFQVGVPSSRGVEIQTYWVAKKLDLPIKMECREGHFSLEYKSIKEGKVPDRLFELPPGYRKTTTPQDFDNAVDH